MCIMKYVLYSDIALEFLLLCPPGAASFPSDTFFSHSIDKFLFKPPSKRFARLFSCFCPSSSSSSAFSVCMCLRHVSFLMYTTKFRFPSLLPSFPPTFLGPDLLSGSSQTCMPFPPQQIFSCIIAPSVSSSALKTCLLPSSYILRCSIPPVIFFFPSSTSCLLLVFSFFLFLFSCHHILLCDTRFLVPLPFCALHLYTRMS